MIWRRCLPILRSRRVGWRLSYLMRWPGWCRRWRVRSGLSETPVEYRNAPPLLGEHTLEVLQRVLGLDADAVAALKEAGVL